MIHVDRLAAYKAARVLTAATPVGHPMPILRSIHLRARAGSDLKMTTTDTGTWLTVTLPAQVDADLMTCVPAKLLAQLLQTRKKRDAGAVQLSLQGRHQLSLEGYLLLVETPGSSTKGTISALDPADFPLGPGHGEDPTWKLIGSCDMQALQDALTWVRLAAGTDPGRPHLCAVYLDDGVAAATDGHRLHIAPSPLTVKPSLLLSSSTVRILQQIPAEGRPIELLVTRMRDRDRVHEVECGPPEPCTILRAQYGAWEVVTTPPDACLPLYRQVVPNRGSSPIRFRLSPDAKAAFVETLKGVVSLRGKSVCFHLDESPVMRISFDDVETGSLTGEVPLGEHVHEYEGEQVVYFNPRLILNAIEDAEGPVDIGLDGAPGDPRGGGPARIDFPDGRIALIMPKRD